jgi:hypothetical protein
VQEQLCVVLGDREELQACPKCKESRWEDVDGSRHVPHKVLRHFPLISRSQWIFATEEQQRTPNSTRLSERRILVK